jgi:hypothetical protein
MIDRLEGLNVRVVKCEYMESWAIGYKLKIEITKDQRF